jgi:hypothetical protein
VHTGDDDRDQMAGHPMVCTSSHDCAQLSAMPTGRCAAGLTTRATARAGPAPPPAVTSAVQTRLITVYKFHVSLLWQRQQHLTLLSQGELPKYK